MRRAMRGSSRSRRPSPTRLTASTTSANASPGQNTVHGALARYERLEAIDPRQTRVIECRVFAGMSVEETADALELSAATVKRDWSVARAWLNRELSA